MKHNLIFQIFIIFIKRIAVFYNLKINGRPNDTTEHIFIFYLC